MDLKNTINVCHEKLIRKEWNEKNVRMYGAVNYISEKEQDKIIEHADNYLALQSSLFLNEEDNILEKMQLCFLGNIKWIGGPYYNGTLEVYQFLDCIMYLLFLRVAKTTKGVISDWINRNQKDNSYNVMKKYMYRKIIEAESG